jgi:NAD(P)-dependent dehydrogenase (short-subunit alcohol dehydrogenase family)
MGEEPRPVRRALVTGAAQGLGALIAERLAADGFAVVGLDLRFASSTGVALEHRLECDVSDHDAVGALVRPLDPLDVLVNCAGVFPKAPAAEITPEQWARVIDVNLSGAWYVTQASLPALRRSGSASVVNIVSGTVARGFPGLAHYVASKAGLVGLTRSLARELGSEGIRFNAVAPGLMRTDAAVDVFSEEEFAGNLRTRCLPLELDVADIVGAVSYLCGDESRMMTGQVLTIDGGSTMR